LRPKIRKYGAYATSLELKRDKIIKIYKRRRVIKRILSALTRKLSKKSKKQRTG